MIHPVDVLKNFIKLDSKTESELRAICDEKVFDVDNYLQNYYVAEQIENVRISRVWHRWLHMGLLSALLYDKSDCNFFGIIDSERI